LTITSPTSGALSIFSYPANFFSFLFFVRDEAFLLGQRPKSPSVCALTVSVPFSPPLLIFPLILANSLWQNRQGPWRFGICFFFLSALFVFENFLLFPFPSPRLFFLLEVSAREDSAQRRAADEAKSCRYLGVIFLPLMRTPSPPCECFFFFRVLPAFRDRRQETSTSGLGTSSLHSLLSK